jgi:hypothetical protein
VFFSYEREAMEKAKAWLLGLGAMVCLVVGTAVVIALIDKSISDEPVIRGQIIDLVIAEEGDTCMTMFHATVQSCIENGIDPERKAKSGEEWYIVVVPDKENVNRLILRSREQRLSQSK